MSVFLPPHKHLTKAGYLLSFDFGLRYIGVAAAQTVTNNARGLTTLLAKQGKPKWYEVGALIAEHQPCCLVVGLPLNMDESWAQITKDAQAFAQQLSQRYQLDVYLQDERLTSHEAEQNLSAAQKSGQAQTDHELAACLIANSWLAQVSGN